MSDFAETIADGMTEFGATATSGYRPGAKVRTTGTPSLHATSDAVDIQIPNGDQIAHEKLAAYYRLRGYQAKAETLTDPNASPNNQGVIVHVQNRASAVTAKSAPAKAPETFAWPTDVSSGLATERQDVFSTTPEQIAPSPTKVLSPRVRDRRATPPPRRPGNASRVRSRWNSTKRI